METSAARAEGTLAGNTIIGVPFESQQAMRSLIVDTPAAPVIDEPEFRQRLFKIRAADSSGHRSSASILINRMYATRGYHANPLPATDVPDRITLTAAERDAVIGTISIGFDSPIGLLCDELYLEEINVLRDKGLRVCEFTKLAIDSVVRSKRVLASLFHVAYIYAHRIKGFHQLVIEVNPRHVRYYERMLGFQVAGPRRMNRRVSAPAVMMSLDFHHARDEIARLGGRPEMSDVEHSLYPFFFSIPEEAGIVGRLHSHDSAPSDFAPL
jgi:hypothetical protein